MRFPEEGTMRWVWGRSAVSTVAVAASFALLGACQATASAEPPGPELNPDTGFFYSTSVPTYISADGKRTISFNALMNIMDVAETPRAVAGVGVDEKCSLPGIACITMFGVSMSEPPRMENSYAPQWTTKSGTFRVVKCANEARPKCLSLLVAFEGKDGTRGWYVHSETRGVEMFGRLNAAGASEDVFVLFGERGVLFKR
jgi:hypothetical protein